MNNEGANQKGELDLIRLALTISPPDIPYLLTKEILQKHLQILSRIQSKFELYPELDKLGRLHYHGILYKSSLDLKKDIEILKKIGYIKIKDIDNIKGWTKYCKKEWKLTKKLLHRKGPLTNADCLGLSDSYDLSKYGIMSNN